MKRILVTAILGLTAIVSVRGQGAVYLYSYAGNGDPGRINYGPGTGGSIGTGLVNGYPGQWTVGFYYANGPIASTVNAAMQSEPGNWDDPSWYGLSLGGAVTTLLSGYPGQFGNSIQQSVFIPGSNNSTVTLVVVAYVGASYATAVFRGHSVAFEMTAISTPQTPLDVGQFMPTFSITLVPEPSTFALALIGLAGLWFSRHRRRID